jgi:plasmid stabilization system protein ParE
LLASLETKGEEQVSEGFDLEKLIVDVLAPERGERVLVMSDLPHGDIADHESWAARRQMAQEWRDVFERLGEKVGFHVLPLLTYPATGGNNADLPEQGEMGGELVRLADVMADANIVVALTQYSASAPLLANYIKDSTERRAASMPKAARGMEETALAADYREVARKAHVLAQRLDRAKGARATFSTGHQLYFDLRFRKAGADDGMLHRDKQGMRLINLPSGEAFKVPYEGEIEGEPSETEGEIPVVIEGEPVVYEVRQNRIVEVIGEGPAAEAERAFFAVDPARCNIAELGLGTNEKAVIRGIVVEDEKVPGLHWACGRSEHIGGVTGVSSFCDPRNVVHKDTVYAQDAPIGVRSLLLLYEDGTEEEIIRDNTYTMF